MKTTIDNVDGVETKTVGQNGSLYIGKEHEGKKVKVAWVVLDE
jgi:hypothetical protein